MKYRETPEHVATPVYRHSLQDPLFKGASPVGSVCWGVKGWLRFCEKSRGFFFIGTLSFCNVLEEDIIPTLCVLLRIIHCSNDMVESS